MKTLRNRVFTSFCCWGKNEKVKGSPLELQRGKGGGRKSFQMKLLELSCCFSFRLQYQHEMHRPTETKDDGMQAPFALIWNGILNVYKVSFLSLFSSLFRLANVEICWSAQNKQVGRYRCEHFTLSWMIVRWCLDFLCKFCYFN